MDVTGKDYLRRHCVLRDATGRVVQEGDRLRDFRGEVWIVAGGTPPHKPGSTGRIAVFEPRMGERPATFYPSVFDCVWVAG